MSLSWDEFARVDMRVGVVVDAQEFPEARRPGLQALDRLRAARHQALERADHRALRAGAISSGAAWSRVVNFPPKQIGPFVSEVLVLGAYDEAGQVILLRPDFDAPPGSQIG